MFCHNYQIILQGFWMCPSSWLLGPEQRKTVEYYKLLNPCRIWLPCLSAKCLSSREWNSSNAATKTTSLSHPLSQRYLLDPFDLKVTSLHAGAFLYQRQQMTHGWNLALPLFWPQQPEKSAKYKHTDAGPRINLTPPGSCTPDPTGISYGQQLQVNTLHGYN